MFFPPFGTWAFVLSTNKLRVRFPFVSVHFVSSPYHFEADCSDCNKINLLVSTQLPDDRFREDLEGRWIQNSILNLQWLSWLPLPSSLRWQLLALVWTVLFGFSFLGPCLSVVTQLMATVLATNLLPYLLENGFNTSFCSRPIALAPSVLVSNYAIVLACASCLPG